MHNGRATLRNMFRYLYDKTRERNSISPTKPKFYKRFVDDIFTRRTKNIPDSLLQRLNTYHPNINFTCETNPDKFLDTRLIKSDNTYETSVYRKETSCVPKRYKRSAINGDLSRAKRISSDFEKEKMHIRSEFKKADYPTPFVNNVIRDFERKIQMRQEEDSILIYTTRNA